MSAAARPARCPLGVRPAERRVGPREPRRDPAPAARPPVGRQRPRRLEPHPQPVHRAAPRDHHRGGRRGLRLQPRLLGQLPRRGRGRRRSTRPASGSGSARTRSPGRSSRATPSRPRRRCSSTRTPGSAAMSDALHGLYRERLARGTWRDRPRPVLLNNWEGDLLRLRRGEAARDRDRRRATSASSCSSSMTAGSASATTTRARSATGSSTGASCPTASTASPPKVEALGIRFGLWIEPEMVSERSRLFEAHPDWAIGVPGRPRTESRQQLVLDMSRPEIVDHLVRRPVRGPRQRPDLVHQVGHEPDDHRAVQHRPCRPTARASSSTATSSASTTCTPG